jgi:hypothetical protein
VQKILHTLAGINPRVVVTYCDRLQFLLGRSVTAEQQVRLRKLLEGNTNYVDIRPNEPPRDFELILTVVNPTERGLLLLATQPGLTPRTAEFALDLILDQETRALTSHALFDRHFVQPWHGQRETTHYATTTNTGDARPGHRFTFYSDRPSKRTSDPHCLHVEARYMGIVALRRIGIEDPRGLSEFDHVAFWNKHLKLYYIDLGRLGRWHANKLSGERRQQVKVWRSGRFSYNEDRSLGSALFRLYGRHSKEPTVSVQCFVDRYGRGKFLEQMDVSALRPRPGTLY